MLSVCEAFRSICNHLTSTLLHFENMIGHIGRPAIDSGPRPS